MDSANAMNHLYSITPFHTTGSTVVNGPATVHTINQVLERIGNYPGKREELAGMAEDQSTVIAIESDGFLVKSGFLVTRLPDYRMNRILYDQHAEEYVMMSNGRCVLPHESREAFAESHKGEMSNCLYAPSEAIALRVFIQGGKAVCAWTYREVNPANLRSVRSDVETQLSEDFQTILGRRRSKAFIGRV